MPVSGVGALDAGRETHDRSRNGRVGRGPVAFASGGSGPILAIAPILAHMLPTQMVGADARAPRALAFGIRGARVAGAGETVKPFRFRGGRAHAVPTVVLRFAGHGLRGRDLPAGGLDVHRALVPVVGRVAHRVRVDADLVAGLVAGLRTGDATVLVVMRAHELAVAHVDLRMARPPHDVAGLQVRDLGPVMPFETGFLQDRALVGRAERGRADIEAGLFQRVVDQGRAIVVRIAVTPWLTVAMRVVRGDVLRPFDP